MEAVRWGAVRALFEEVADLPPAPRAARLADTARADPELYREVERLLAADAAADARLAPIEAALGSGTASAAGPADPLGLLGRTVAHFRVVEPIATGGMGVVYRAEDTRLRRAVALKLPLPHCLADGTARRRFLREGHAAAALDHPNVCTVHEVGETDDGHPYIAMALCPGETLKARLAREGALPASDALAIARAVARGLGAAHAAGVVHRDVKPGNVMLVPDGDVKVLDFGLAHVRDLDASASRTTAGTVAYMAPEQIRGAPVDARTDLWALGVVLYEMLAGRPPFDGDNDAAVLYAIVHEEPTPLSALDAHVPPAVDAVVRGLLAKDRERRPATAAQVETMLDAAPRGPTRRGRWTARVAAPRARRIRRAAAVLSTLVIAGGASLFHPGRFHSGASAPGDDAERPPTANAEAYTLYRRGREYEARPRTRESLASARQLYERAVALDPHFALAHAHLAIVLHAIVAVPFELTDSIENEAWTAAETALRERPDLGEAHHAMGHMWTMDRQWGRAIAEYERAAAAMPRNAEVYVDMAVCLRSLGRVEEALARLEQAARLDPDAPTLLRQLAATQSNLRRYDAAARTWDRVLTLWPDDHDAALARGWQYLRLGVTDSLAAVVHALPPDWDPRGTVSWARFTVARMERRPAEALAAVRAMRDTATETGILYRPRALLQAQAYAAMGDRVRARSHFLTARAELERHVAAWPRAARHFTALGLTYAGLGDRTRALAAADRALAIAGAPAANPLAMALTRDAAEIRVRVGDTDVALALLERLLGLPAGQEVSVALLRADPVWEPLRTDPRFERLVRRFANR